MKFNRLALTALLMLTPVLVQADVDVAAIKAQIVSTINDLQGKVIPTATKIANAVKSGDTSVIEAYLADPNKQLIPQEAFQFVTDNIDSVKQLAKTNLPNDVVDALNKVSSFLGVGYDLGTQLKELKTQAATALQNVNLKELFNSLSAPARQVTTGNIKAVAQNIIEEYKKANIDPQQLATKANALVATLGSLRSAAESLQKEGVIDTLNQLTENVPTYIAGGQEVREELFDQILGLVMNLKDQLPTAQPFINAFGSFVSELVPFTEQLYTNFAPVIWAQVPADQQKTAKNALDVLQQNKGLITDNINNVISIVKGKIQEFVSKLQE